MSQRLAFLRWSFLVQIPDGKDLIRDCDILLPVFADKLGSVAVNVV